MAKIVNPLKPLTDKLPKPLRNKYIITLIIFFIIVLLSKINPYTQWKLIQSKEELIDKKAYYEDKLEEVNQDREDNKKHIEKFAREKYYMKKRDEDVFVIEKEKETE